METPQNFSDIWKLLTTACKAPSPSLLRKLQVSLRNAKNSFTSPLANPPKNQEHRQKLSQANATPVAIGGRNVLLTPAEIQYSVSLSDRLNINEYSAVELYKSAQKQAQPSEDIASVAESLHFTERYYFLVTLCNLIKGRMDQNLSSDLRAILVDFSDDLLRDGLARKLIRLLGTLNALIAPLQNATEDQQALQTRYKDEMRSLAESVFFIFYQIPISTEDMDTLVTVYRDVAKNVRFLSNPSPASSAAAQSSGSRVLAQLSATASAPQLSLPNAVTLSSLLAPVVTMQPQPNSLLEYQVAYVLMLTMVATFAVSSDSPSEWSSTKLIADKNWLSKFARDLSTATENSVWMGPLCFSFALLLNELFERSNDAPAPGVSEKLVEALVDRALGSDLFSFMRELVRSRPFQNDTDNKLLYVSVLDELLTNFICKMSMKLRQLRDQVELIRQMQQQQQQQYQQQQQMMPSSLRQQSTSGLNSQNPNTSSSSIPKPHFVYLLRFAAALYPECGELHLKYWTESTNPSAMNTNDTNSSVSSSFVSMSSSPTLLLRITAESLSELIFAPFVDLLTALATSPQSAAYAYEYLRRGSNTRFASWDHFFGVLKRYYIDFQESEAQQLQQQQQQAAGAGGGGFSSAQQSSNWNVSGNQMKGIRQEDLLGLEAILRLMAEVIRRSPASGLLMYETAEWRALETLFGLLGCPVPPSLKGQLLNVISSFATITELVGKIWSLLEVAQVLPTASSAQQQYLMQQQQQQQSSNPNFGYTQPYRVGGGVAPGGSGSVQQGAPQTSGVVLEGGIRFELEEVESRYEEYPETLAFVKLLCELVSRSPVSMLVKLGSSYRSDGILPYIRFVRDSVLLKFDARAYRFAGEQWRIAAAALQLMYLIVEPYEIASGTAGDESQHSALILGKTPTTGANMGNVTAAEVVRDVLSTSMSSLLRKLLSLITHGAENLEKQRFATEFGADYERTVLFALKIVENVLRKESTQLVSSLDKLLMRDRQVLLNISRYINYTANNELVALSVKIIDLLSLKQRLVSVFLEASEDESLIRSYAERLQVDEEQPEDASMSSSSAMISSSSSVRHAILQLLLRNISSLGSGFSTVPNFAHLLLGFDVNNLAAQSVTRTDLSLSTVPNCLSVLVSLLENPSFPQVFPLLAEEAYELLYRLIASPETADPTLRYLRNRPNASGIGDFFSSQLNAASAPWSLENSTVPPHLPHIYHRIFVLRCLALELHMCALADHRAQLQSLLTQMFVAPTSEQPQVASEEDFAFVATPQQGRMKSLELLQLVSFAVPQVRPLSRGPAAALAQMIDLRSFATVSPRYKGAILIDVKALHAFLIAQTRLDVDHTISPAQYQQIQKEISEILKNAAERNAYALTLHAKQQLFDSWRQIVGIAMSECYAYLPRGALESGERILYALLGQLLDHLNVSDASDGALSQGQVHVDHVALLGDGISATVLQLITKLREQKFGDEEFEYRGALPVAQLHSLLESLLKAVVAAGASASMRSNLYASLSNYLQFTQKKIKALYAPDQSVPPLTQNANNAAQSGNPSQFGTYLAADEIASQQRLLEQGNIRILEEVGERLVAMLSADAADGPLVCRAVSFATLDSLLMLDHQHRWLHCLWSRGFLRYFLDSLSAGIVSPQQQSQIDSQSSASPILMLEPVLFVYENLLSLFKRIASSAKGARLLVEGGVLSRLSGSPLMMIVTNDASSSAAAANFAGVPAEELAVQTHLLHHVLQLLVSLLTALPKHEDVCVQTLEFIQTHSHLISNILKDGSETAASLRSIYLTTSIFTLLAPHYVLMNQKLGARAPKMESRLMSLLLRLCASETLYSKHAAAMNFVFGSYDDEVYDGTNNDQFEEEESSSHFGETSVRSLPILTTRNLLSYCRIVMEKGGYGVGASSLVQNALPRLLFAPRLANISSSSAGAQGVGGGSGARPLHDPIRAFTSPSASTSSIAGKGPAAPVARPNLYALSHYLHTCVRALNRNVKNHDTLTFKLTHLNEIAPPELNKLARKAIKSGASPAEEMLSTNYKQHLAQWKLQELLAENARESSTLMFIIEALLMLLWRHLELFLTSASTSSAVGYFPSAESSSGAAMFAISKQEQDELRRDASGSLADSLAQISKFDKPYRSAFAILLARRLRELVSPQLLSSNNSNNMGTNNNSNAPSTPITMNANNNNSSSAPSYLFRA